MESATSEASSEASSSLMWTEWFLGRKGSELFSDVDSEFIADKFNLVGLNTEVPHFNFAYKLITDSLDEDLNETIEAEVDLSAKHLYGLIHARFILSSSGLAKMFEKYNDYEFGTCTRVFCDNNPLLPVGMSDIPGERSVKLYCPRCQDVYCAQLKRHENVDGAYFGTTFAHLFLIIYPACIPTPVSERYIPKIFGFKVHTYAQEFREQNKIRQEQEVRLEKRKVLENVVPLVTENAVN